MNVENALALIADHVTNIDAIATFFKQQSIGADMRVQMVPVQVLSKVLMAMNMPKGPHEDPADPFNLILEALLIFDLVWI